MCHSRHWASGGRGSGKQTPEGLDIHLVCDSYGTHQTPEVRKWLASRPRFHMHFTPTECCFRSVQLNDGAFVRFGGVAVRLPITVRTGHPATRSGVEFSHDGQWVRVESSGRFSRPSNSDRELAGGGRT